MLQNDLPVPPVFREGDSERSDAVHDGTTDLELCDLTVKGVSHQALTRQFHTKHLRPCTVSAVVTAPSSPQRAAEMLRRHCASLRAAPAVTDFQGFAILRGGRMAAAPRSAMASGTCACRGPRSLPGNGLPAKREGGRDAGDLLIGRDLVEQLWHHGRIANVATGNPHRPDLQCFLINPKMDLAPDTAFRTAMLARSSGKPSPVLFLDPPSPL